MTLGLSLTNFTILHTVISLVQLISGIAVVAALVGSRSGGGWMTTYLVSAVLTCVTGFMFPVSGILPSHIVGAISLALLVLAIVALYSFHLAGAWRWVFAICIVITVFFSAFVTVAQTFLKVPFAHALAPTGSEPPFAIAQGILLLIFIGLGIAAVRKFHPATA